VQNFEHISLRPNSHLEGTTIVSKKISTYACIKSRFIMQHFNGLQLSEAN